jgi:hypothetical protein
MPRKRSNSIPGQFSAQLIEMLESPAWRALSLSAHRVIDRIAIELGHHGGTDNGRLPVTYDQFVEYGIDRHAIAPAIREAEALGFIEVTAHGRANAGEFRSPNLFRLTYAYCKDTPPTDEWRRIATADEAGLVAWNARRRKAPASWRTIRKNKKPVGENTSSSGDFPHRKPKSRVGVSHTTVPVGDSHTTSIFRVRDGKLMDASSPMTAGSPSGRRDDDKRAAKPARHASTSDIAAPKPRADR